MLNFNKIIIMKLIYCYFNNNNNISECCYLLIGILVLLHLFFKKQKDFKSDVLLVNILHC